MVLQDHSKTNQFGNREMITPMVAYLIRHIFPALQAAFQDNPLGEEVLPIFTAWELILS